MKRNQLGLFPSLNTFLDDLFNQGFVDIAKSSYAGFPATNVKDEDNAYLLELAVPGFEKDNFAIEVDKGTLIVSGNIEEHTEGKGEEGTYHRREFVQREFSRSFRLPDHVDAKAIKAEYAAGILTLTLPKLEKTDDKLLIDVA